MIRPLLLSLPALLGACTSAPRNDPEPDLPRRLVDLSLAQGRARELLRDLVTVAPHRLSGSAGAARAVEWGRAAMQGAGLQNVRLEKVTVPRWVRGEVEEVTVLTPSGEERLPALALGGSVGTPPGGIEAEVLMVRAPEELERNADRAKGRIIFFNRPMARAAANTFRAYGAAVPQRTRGAVLAAKAGGVAAIVRSMTTRLDDVPHTGAMRYADGVPKVPAAAVSTKAAERLAALLRAGGPVRIRVRLSCRTEAPVESANVVGEIPGRDKPDEVVVIGGHLDCWDVGQGAHDDGSGIVHCLEAARLLLAAGLRPKRTIRVVFFMNEENGLAGGRQYFADHGSETHVAAIESDRGGFAPLGFTTSAKGDELAAYRRVVARLEPFGMGRLDGGGGGADIGPLRANDVPLFGLLPEWKHYFDFHHSERDRLGAVDPRDLARGAAAVAWLAYSLAEG